MVDRFTKRGKEAYLPYIDSIEAEGDYVNDLYRAADYTPPPRPTGLRIVSALHGVYVTVEPEIDLADNEPDFNQYVVYKAESLDDAGDPIEAMPVGRFGRGGAFISLTAGTHAFFAVKAVDFSQNESPFSDWALGYSLTDQGAIDQFNTHGGQQQIENDADLSWLELDDMESDSGWSSTEAEFTTALNSTEKIHGDYGVKFSVTAWASGVNPWFEKTVSFDLAAEGRFADDDYLFFYLYVNTYVAAADLAVYFISGNPASANFYYHTLSPAPSAGQNFIYIKKSDFTVSGTPDWADITRIYFYVTNSSSPTTITYEFTVDDMRVVKATEYSLGVHTTTGDLWRPIAEGVLTPTTDWHIHQDMPGHSFALAQVRSLDSLEFASLVREDVDLNDASHLCNLIFDASEGGQAGRLFRVQRPEAIMEASILNATFQNGNASPIGATHSSSSSSLIYSTASVSSLEGYVSALPGGDLSYLLVALVGSDNEGTLYLTFQPSSDYTQTDFVLAEHRIDANNWAKIHYVAASDVYRISIKIDGGSTLTADSPAQTFGVTTDQSIALALEDDTGRLILDGVEVASVALNDVYPTTTGTLHVLTDYTDSDLFLGRVYQVAVDAVAHDAGRLLVWHNYFFDNQDEPQKVATENQRRWYYFGIDTSANEAVLVKNIPGLQTELATVAMTVAVDTVYYLGVKTVNLDQDNDSIPDAVKIQAWATDTQADLFDADTQLFNTTLAASTSPLYSGGVGLRQKEGGLTKFADVRDGSPKRADYAERAGLADSAKTLTNDRRPWIGAKELYSADVNPSLEGYTTVLNMGGVEGPFIYGSHRYSGERSGNKIVGVIYWTPTDLSSIETIATNLHIVVHAAADDISSTAAKVTEAADLVIDTTDEDLKQTTAEAALAYSPGDLVSFAIDMAGGGNLNIVGVALEFK